MSLSLLLEGVRAHLVQSAHDLVATEVVDKLVSAATFSHQLCADLPSSEPAAVPGNFPSVITVLKDGNTIQQLEVVVQLRAWANQMPGSFELPESSGQPSGTGEAPPNMLALALAVAVQIGNDEVRVGAIRALGDLGFRALPVMAVVAFRIAHVASTVDERRESARVLGRTGHPEAAWPLLRRLDDPDEHPLVKCEAAAGLAALGPCASFALPSLLDALGSDSLELQRQARNALRRIDPKLSETVALLNRGLERRWFMCLWHMVVMLWCWIRRSPQAPVLEASRSARLLGLLGREAVASAPQLLRATESWTPEIRAAALEALGRIGPGEKIVRTTAEKLLLLDRNSAVRIAACACLEAAALFGLTADEHTRMKAVFQLRTRSETDSEVRHRLSTTAERLWGAPVTVGATPAETSLEHIVKKQLTGNIISLIFRGIVLLLRRIVLG